MIENEWEQREVCPDGACIGVIGADGLCKVCGRAAPGYGDYRKSPPPVADEAEDAEAAQAATAEPDAGDDPEWSRRKLCPDGACTGVIGADGRCKVCGGPAS